MPMPVNVKTFVFYQQPENFKILAAKSLRGKLYEVVHYCINFLTDKSSKAYFKRAYIFPIL